MKNILSVAAVALLLMSAVSCAAKDPPNSTDTHTSGNINTDSFVTTTSKPVQTGSSGKPTIIPIVGGVTAVTSSYEVKEKGVVALKVSLSMPVAEISSNEDVEKKLSERLDAIKLDITQYIGQLEELYKSTISIGGSHLFTPRISVSFVLNYFTEKAMSLTFNITEVNGYGVTTQTSRHYNYEFDFASKITFGAFFSDRNAVISALCTKASERGDLYSNANDLIKDLAEDCWYIADGKIIFKFNPYDIAPASGEYVTVVFEINELSEYMSDYGKDLLGIR